MRPVIGITMPQNMSEDNLYLPRAYWKTVWEAGGLPILLPPLDKQSAIKRILDKIDGLLLSGGVDIDPLHYHQEPWPGIGEITPERDCFELALVSFTLNRDIPVLGICRGIQILNVAAGGTLVQDIGRQWPNPVEHMQKAPRCYATHDVLLDRQSRIAVIYEVDEIRVNSFHHQAVGQVGTGFKVTARARDRVVEAIEAEGKNFIIGVQWHPESMWENDRLQEKLFAAFIRAACEGRLPEK